MQIDNILRLTQHKLFTYLLKLFKELRENSTFSLSKIVYPHCRRSPYYAGSSP